MVAKPKDCLIRCVYDRLLFHLSCQPLFFFYIGLYSVISICVIFLISVECIVNLVHRNPEK